MNVQPRLTGDRRIAWRNVLTVVSAAILIGAEVFGAAFAGGWAVGNLLELGRYGEHIMQGVFFACGVADHGGVHPQRPARRAVHHARITRARFPPREPFAPALRRVGDLFTQISCNAGEHRLFAPLPNFARACGRVSVGGHPDKRPDSRPERDRRVSAAII